jgi:uncharacterized repeat protein (TIGR03803 family)
MTKLNGRKVGSVVVVICVATAIAAQAQMFTTLADFDNSNGDYGYSLVQGTDGNFYGITSYGGPKGDGTFFRITPAGELSTLHNFCSKANCSDGSLPSGVLVLALDGNFYGTTYGGGTGDWSFCSGGYGCGTIFRISRKGELATLYSFCSQANCADGARPLGALIQALDGDLYGTTSNKGANDGGTVFKLSLGGSLTTLYSFCSKAECADGGSPESGLIQASDGNFYGTTAGGGKGNGRLCPWSGSAYGCGTIFRLTPTGRLSTIHQFRPGTGSTDGADPMVSLIESSGNLIGTTSLGGDDSGCTNNEGYGCGTVFRIDPSGVETQLHLFEWTDGVYPGPSAGLVLATDGNFYGTTWYGGANNDGILFRLSPEGALTTVHTFDNTDGAQPYALIQATSGIFYGVTNERGTFSCGSDGNCGTVFSLNMGLNPFVSFVIPAGRVGWTGGILGQGFTGTTSVAINGVPAAFRVVSDTYLTATVPLGATNGYVTVTTPTGVLTSNVPFRVIQ